MTINKIFIKQTSLDYDIPYDVVENIYIEDYENLYERLEEIIKKRQSCF